jgi:hypothetical protein
VAIATHLVGQGFSQTPMRQLVLTFKTTRFCGLLYYVKVIDESIPSP